MEFVSFEIIGPLTSPPVLLSGVALALVFLSGLAAKTLQLIEDLIADGLFVGHETVKSHVGSVLMKLEVQGRTQAVIARR